MESQILEETLKIEELKENITNDPPRRLASIDFIKGLAIIFIILAHTSGAWFTIEWLFLHGIVYMFLDILGPSLFIFLSALSVVFSLKRKKGRLPDKVIRNNIFARGLMLILVGALINAVLLANEIYPPVYSPLIYWFWNLVILFPLTLWGWNIIFFLGFSQIFCYYALKLKRVTRLIIGVLIIISSELLRELIWILKEEGLLIGIILHFLIDSLENTVTFLPWVSICFITTVFGEYLYEAMMNGSDEAYKRLFKIFLTWGIILTVFGIVSGFVIVNGGNINGHLYRLTELTTAQNQPFTDITGTMKFLIRGTFSNMFYNMGTSLVIIALGFYLTDIKKKDNLLITLIKFYGLVSLNLFLIHFLFLPLFQQFYPIWYFPFTCLVYEAFLGFLLYIWKKFGGYVGTPEWLMGKVLGMGKKNHKT